MAPLYLTMALVIREPSKRPSALDTQKGDKVFLFLTYFSCKSTVLFKSNLAGSQRISHTSHKGQYLEARGFQRELWWKLFLRICQDSSAACNQSIPKCRKNSIIGHFTHLMILNGNIFNQMSQFFIQLWLTWHNQTFVVISWFFSSYEKQNINKYLNISKNIENITNHTKCFHCTHTHRANFMSQKQNQ